MAKKKRKISGTKPTPRRKKTTVTSIEVVVKEYRRPGGRKLTVTEQNQCVSLRVQGYTIFEVAQKLDCDPNTVIYWSKKAGYSTKNRRYEHMSTASFGTVTTGRSGIILNFTCISGKSYNILKL